MIYLRLRGTIEEVKEEAKRFGVVVVEECVSLNGAVTCKAPKASLREIIRWFGFADGKMLGFHTESEEEKR